MKPYYVYSQRICAELMLMKHKLIGVDPSKKHDGFNVFVFIDSKELKNDVKELTTAKK